MKSIISAYDDVPMREQDGYEGFLSAIRNNFNNVVAFNNEPLFTTNATGLFDLFLSKLPEDARQHYNCRCCQQFIDRFGGVVQVDADGRQIPVMWGLDTPVFFASAVDALHNKVKDAKVNGVFITENGTLGTPVTGSWHHMAVDVPRARVHRDKLHTAYQVTAAKAEDHRLLCQAVHNYKADTVKTAVKLLQSESLYRSERVLGVAEWLMNIQSTLSNLHNAKRRNNILWYKAATAPAGFCHVSSSMIGTLLDDIEAGLDFDSVSRKFAEKMNPLQYQRPQAAPTAGNVAQAEKIVEKLGIQNSLHRRFARLDEITALWRPTKEQPKHTGIFAGIATKGRTPAKADVIGPEITMTWEKFRATVLPTARKIEFYAGMGLDNYSAILTAADPAAPPILQWDTEEQRNPFSWYVYHGGTSPNRWNLAAGWREVSAVMLQPSMWNGGHDGHGKAVFFILLGAKDTGYRGSGSALFPEILKSELREIRSTIEAYSRMNDVTGYDEASACGIRLQGGGRWNARFRVTTDLGTTVYRLDRWD